MIVQRDGAVSCGLLPLILICATASGQETRVNITADTGRPVARAIELLESRHPGVVVTYEDPRYSYVGDLRDVTAQVRRDQHLYRPGEAPRVLVPAADPFPFSYDVLPATGQPPDWTDLLDRMVNAFEKGSRGGRFRVEQLDDTYHVIPVEIRGTDGKWISQSSILDVTISVAGGEQTGLELLAAIAKEISEQSGESVVIGTIPVGLLANYIGSLEAENEKARTVLMRLFSDILERRTGRLSWKLFYGPDVKHYALNIYAVAPVEPVYDPIPPPPIDLPSGNPATRGVEQAR